MTTIPLRKLRHLEIENSINFGRRRNVERALIRSQKQVYMYHQMWQCERRHHPVCYRCGKGKESKDEKYQRLKVEKGLDTETTEKGLDKETTEKDGKAKESFVRWYFRQFTKPDIPFVYQKWGYWY